MKNRVLRNVLLSSAIVAIVAIPVISVSCKGRKSRLIEKLTGKGKTTDKPAADKTPDKTVDKAK